MAVLAPRKRVVKHTTDLARTHRNGGPRKLTGANTRNVTLGFHLPQRDRPARVQHPKRVRTTV